MNGNRPRVLIEEWLPVAAIGAESQRERGASSALPPLYFLHVWWARRPLAASRAAVLASLMPAWSADWPEDLRKKFPTREAYQQWFLSLIGILGDPVAGRKLIQYAKEKGLKLKSNPFGYPRAFTNTPEEADLVLMRQLLEATWGEAAPTVLDPMSGGGSIPFEALRFGFHTHANELNPVAATILKATLDYPARYGMRRIAPKTDGKTESAADTGRTLAEWIKTYGNDMARRIEKRLAPFYPRQEGEKIFAYVWSRTVACPATGKPVPLSPNWWLQKGGDPVAARLICEKDRPACRFEIVKGKQAAAARPDDGTIRRGTAVSPWTEEVIDGDYIKAEAQAGRMGQQLYALGIQTDAGKDSRPPTKVDLAAIHRAEEELGALLPKWEAKGLIPTEDIPDGNKTSEPRRYGMNRWKDIFSPRQLLALGTYLEVLAEVMAEARKALPKEEADAVRTYLAFAIDKACDYNSRMVRWHSSRGVIAGTFDRHDFSFKWSHAEFDAAHNLSPGRSVRSPTLMKGSPI